MTTVLTPQTSLPIVALPVTWGWRGYSRAHAFVPLDGNDAVSVSLCGTAPSPSMTSQVPSRMRCLLCLRALGADTRPS